MAVGNALKVVDKQGAFLGATMEWLEKPNRARIRY